MIALLVVALGAVVAAVGTGVLVARSTSKPRIYSVAWSLALFGLAIGLAAATLGYPGGLRRVLFRAMEFGTQLIAPLSLVLALVETDRQEPGRQVRHAARGRGHFGHRAGDPRDRPDQSGRDVQLRWPDPAKFYQLAPLTVLGLIALLTAIDGGQHAGRADAAGPGGTGCRARRPGRCSSPRWRRWWSSLPGLIWLADKGVGISLPIPAQDVFALCCTVAAGLIWYAARMAGNRDLSQVAAGSGSGRDDGDRRSDDDWEDRDGYDRSERPAGGRYDQYGVGRPR